MELLKSLMNKTKWRIVFFSKGLEILQEGGISDSREESVTYL